MVAEFAPTRFTHALVRPPAGSAVDGLRAVDRGAPDIGALGLEHAAYCAALQAAGIDVTALPPLEAFPDSVFVEDPALVFPEGAILLDPGAASRRGEVAAIAPAIRERFETVIELEAGRAEGGDCLTAPDAVLIGLSDRTSREGAEALVRALAALGRPARIVEPPPGVLHFKTACALIDDRTVLATRDLLAAGDVFGGLEVVSVPEGEEPVANALALNGHVLIADGFPKTRALLETRGHSVSALPLDNVMKLDAGLSCMSLRWRARDDAPISC